MCIMNMVYTCISMCVYMYMYLYTTVSAETGVDIYRPLISQSETIKGW